MDNLVACYVDELNRRTGDADTDALSTIVLLHEVLNAELDKKELNFEILFKDETKGIISYLRTLSTKSGVDSKLIDEISNLLKCIIVDFKDIAAKYVSSLVEEFLEPTILHSGSTQLRVMACEILLQLIKTSGITCFQDYERLKKFYNILLHSKTEKSAIPSTEKKKVYQLLGEIINYAPADIDVRKIFRLLCSQIGKQIQYSKDERSSSFKVNEMEGLYDCLQLFLKQFHSEDCVKNSTELYTLVKEGCGMEIPHRKTSIRSAFKILEYQFALFANNVFEDYVWWTNLLTRYLRSSNKDDQLAAFHAFNAFYRGISKVLKEKSDQKDVLKYFIESLQKNMKSSTNNEVALAVQNFGHFAKVCKIHGEKDEIRRMFALTSQIAENCCSGQMEDIELHHISSLLVSMSKIIQNLYDENSYEDEFAIVGKFSAFVVISYPKVSNNLRFIIKNNLIKTFIIFGRISDTILDLYLEKLMFTSLIKCCSCPLERDIEYLNSLGNTKNSDLTSCNDYLPLWKAICNLEKELTKNKIVSDKRKFETVRKKNLPSKVFDIFIKNILNIFEKLDFSVVEYDCNNDEIVVIDNFGLKPKTESDFYIFVNLVELFSAVIKECELDVLEKWIPELITVFIKLSITCSIRSGFFQLFTVIFERAESEGFYVGILLELKSFIIETVVNLRKLKGVDLSGCLRMVLKIPLIVVGTITPYITPVLQVVFTQGVEDLSLARSGLEALQKWKTYLEPQKFRPILEVIVPLLNTYLQSKKTVGDTDTLTKYEERLIMPALTTKNKIYKKFHNMNINSSSTDLLKFQEDILAFMSEIDIDLCRTIYNPEKCNTNEFTEVLRFDVPFRDKKVKIFLDKFLPRISELTHHSNLKTRTTACEMLHSMTIVFLGNTIAVNNWEEELSKPVENLFKQLVTCIFKLGSDDNVAIKLMFTQLSHQLVRYYSREYKSNASAVMLEILFDCVSHANDISLRHFSAGVIKEFVCGSLKDRTGECSSIHMLAVMKYVCLYCVQPCAFKRQGAALAFNSICSVVQERSSLVRTYWIELLVNFVKSSSMNVEDEYDDVETSNALRHIKRVLLENPDVFLENSSSRRVPKCLDDGTLRSVVVWLLRYSISENKLCRNICMDLVVDLCIKLPGIDSLEKFFCNNASEDDSIHGRIVESISLKENFLNCVDIRSHKDEFYHAEFVKRIIKWLRSSLAGLHCLSWLLTEKITSFESSTSDYWFLNSMKFYGEFILPNDLNDYMRERDSRMKPELIPADLKTVYETLKYEAFNEYLKILIVCNILHFEECIGNEMWHTYFWRSCISHLFAPTMFITNSFTQECISDAIPKILFKLKETSTEKQELIYEEIRQNTSHKMFDTFIENLESCHFVALSEKQYIMALNELQKSQIISNIFPNIEERKRQILRRLFDYVKKGSEARSCNPAIVMQLEALLVFGLTDCRVDFVLELLANSSTLTVKNSVEATISHGRHFFNTFRKPFVEFLSRYQKDVTDNYLLPHQLTKEKLLIVIDCLKFFDESPKSISFDELIGGIFKNWTTLQYWSPNDDCAQYLFYLVDAVAVHKEALEKFSPEDKYQVFSWLLNHLLKEKHFLTGGKEYFKSLASFISNSNENYHLTLLSKLKEFRDKYFEASSPTKLKDAEYINMFKALLSLFCNSENVVVLKIVIMIGVSYAHEDCDLSVEQTLESVMRKTSGENQIELLNVVYELFNDVGQLAAFRLGCVQKFLVPLLYTSKEETLKTFFVNRMKSILQILEGPITDSQESNSILLKTAAVSIAEIYMNLGNEDIKLAVSMEGSGNQSITNIINKKIWHIIITPVNLRDRSNASALRVLKCYCYNTFLKTLLNIPKPEQFYVNVFSENFDRRRYIWQSIIDLNEVINLKMFIDEIPARQKALKQKRKELKTKSISGTSMRSIPTQYLSTSSLVSSVKYDMSDWNVSNEGYIMQAENKSYTINLEEDKLNNHECMATVCELIRFIFENNISPLPDPKLNPTPAVPSWMQCLKDSFKVAIKCRRKNVILFFMKMIYNCETIFCPYAKDWVEPIITGVLFLNEINYLTFDMIVTMITWCKVYTPKNKQQNNELLMLILKNIEREETTTVRNHLLELVRTFIRHWFEYVEVPYARLLSIYDRKEKPEVLEVNLTLAKAFLLQGILPFQGEDAAAEKLSSALMFHVDRKEINRGLKILNFEVLALILEVARTKNVLRSCYRKLQEDLVTKLNSLRVDNTQTKTDLFFSCLEHALVCYPIILHRFIPYIEFNFKKFQGKIKAQCLYMVTLDDEDVPEDLFSQLMTMQFANSLRDSNHEIVKNALIVVKKFVQTLKVNELLTILPDIIRLSSHPSSECRQLVYEIADSVFKNYKNENSEELSKIKSQCKIILLNGLLDGDRALQEKIFKSWKERCDFSDQIVDRFISIVKEMYSPENESRFVNYATDFLLDASSETPDYKSKIFDNPLSSSIDFREQDFTPLSMFRNKHPIAPIFVNSLSNQLMGLSLCTSKMCTLVLPGSQQKLFFQPSQNTESSLGGTGLSNTRQWSMNNNSSLQNYSLDEPELRKLRNRLQPSQRKASQYYAKRNIEKKEQRIELLKTRSDRVEKDVQFTRTYRDGEFPDIEIPRSAVIDPLKILGKKDPVIARLIFISLFDGMLSDDARKKDHLKAIGDGFNEILRLTLQHNNVLIETIFETVFFHSEEVQLESQRVMISSHASGLLSLGSLILENSLHSEMLSTNSKHAAKRMKVDGSVHRTKWVQLAELYKALDQNDVVNGILKEKIEGHVTESLKKGLAFEQNSDWRNALKVYGNEISQPSQSGMQSFEEHFIFEAYLKCAANLSRWDEVQTKIKERFPNLDDLWLESWDTEHTLPWLFTAEAICGARARNDKHSVPLNDIKRWLRDEVKSTILNNLITESMAILLFLNGEHIEAKHKVKKSVESMLQNWNHSTASLNKFYKLLTLSEINSMLAPYSDLAPDGTLPVDACSRIVDMWESSSPRCDNLYWWDKRIEYRRLFSSKYLQKLDQEHEEVLERLKTFNPQSCLQMVNVALQQQNEGVATKYFIEVKNNATMITTDLEAQITLNRSKVVLLVAKKLQDVSRYKECLDLLDDYEWNERLSYEYHVHLADALRELQNNWNSLEFDQKKNIIESLGKRLNKPDIVADTVRIEMREAIERHLREAATFAENYKLPAGDTAAAYLSLAKHTEELLTGNDEEENLEYKENYIRCILRALKFDSREAQLLFPTLLQMEQITNETLKSVFVSEAALVEEWKFLVWIQQLLAHIDTDKLPVIEKLLLSIIEKYPNAIQFSLFSSNLMRYNYQNDAAKQLAERLRDTLSRNSAIADFVRAVSCVRIPEGYFFHHMKKLSKAFRRNDVLQIANMKKDMFDDNVRFKGKLFVESKWWGIFRRLFETIENQSSTSASQQSEIDSHVSKLREETAKTRDAQSLSRTPDYQFLRNFSGWFENFGDLEITNIEIPGQYDGFAPPNPERHVRIFEFEKYVQVQSSVQVPIKIRVTGDDAKKYPYLIKFGEDTRQDQRIQQIFSIMNRCSVADSEASGSGGNVSVITYGVFPLTTYFGVIEWLERTTSLRDFMDYQLPDSKKRESNSKILNKLRMEYDENIRRYDRSNQILAHEKAVKNFSKEVIVSSFETIRAKIPADVFRKSILALCNSPIMYWNLRNQFITSYSSLCVYGWILGIGDRHLGNFLVCLKTGRCVGIDFGHAFGTGTTNLEVPELIPFRMTPHIVDIMQPFGLTGLIRETMVNALKVIHKNEYILFATMQIFILDPSFNWLKSIKRRRQELTGIEETEDAQWYPALKIGRIRRKLQGINPVKILEEEVEENTIISTSYKNGCIKLLNREDSWRSRLPVENISLVEQIDSLLDIATDKCILGVSFGGLETYV